MKSPQLEDGYCKIANELLDAICKVNLSAYESKIFWFIIRMTFGFNKKIDRISYNQFEQGTGIRQQHIKRTLDKLLTKNMINQNSFKYSIQKDYDKWISLPKQVVNENTTQIGSETLPKQVVKTLPKQVDTKEKRHYKDKDFPFLPDYFICTEFKETFSEFREHRKSLKSKMTDNAEKMLINKLAKLSDNNSAVAIEIMNESILNGWRGIFQLKNQKQKEPEKIKW